MTSLMPDWWGQWKHDQLHGIQRWREAGSDYSMGDLCTCITRKHTHATGKREKERKRGAPRGVCQPTESEVAYMS
jgi:hypothetical protein